MYQQQGRNITQDSIKIQISPLDRSLKLESLFPTTSTSHVSAGKILEMNKLLILFPKNHQALLIDLSLAQRWVSDER